MAKKTEFVLKSEEFLKKLNNKANKYHIKIMEALAAWMDVVRNTAADKFIIKGRSLKTKPDPTRLTERSGLLTRVLKQKRAWSTIGDSKTREMKLAHKYLRWKIAPQAKGNSFDYVALFDMVFRQEPKRKRKRKKELTERKKIVMGAESRVRFRLAHETGRVRGGRKRQFIFPAIQSEGPKVDKLLLAKLAPIIRRAI